MIFHLMSTDIVQDSLITFRFIEYSDELENFALIHMFISLRIGINFKFNIPNIYENFLLCGCFFH